MDIKKFEINLKKIITLKQNIDLSGEEISGLELALLKNYIKKLYKSIAPEDEDYTELVEELVEKKSKKPEEKVVTEEAKKKEKPEEKQEEIKVEEENVEKEEEAEVVVKQAFNEKLLAIFDVGKTSELSEKLSSTPVPDIKKAIGLNDRIFTINELFGGDKELFNSTVEYLNGLENFDQAKDYLLENIAEKYNWANQDNAKKAKRFVKIVKRRFGVA